MWPEPPRAAPKQRRQASGWVAARPGERVAVPLDGHTLCGSLRGAVATRLVAGAEHLTRGAVFDRTVPRTALRRPYQLQDPQLMFTLRGEAAVRATAGGTIPEE